jgi:hypothetical protein
MLVRQRSSITETCRQGSRALTSERWTSTVGRVDHDPVDGLPARLVQAFDQLALGIGLKAAHAQPERGGVALDALLQLGQREGPVQRGIALAEHVEVDPVQDLDAVGVGHWL